MVYLTKKQKEYLNDIDVDILRMKVKSICPSAWKSSLLIEKDYVWSYYFDGYFYLGGLLVTFILTKEFAEDACLKCIYLMSGVGVNKIALRNELIKQLKKA